MGEHRLTVNMGRLVGKVKGVGKMGEHMLTVNMGRLVGKVKGRE